MKKFLLTLFSLIFLFLAFQGGRAVAAPDPVPPPGRLPCKDNQTEDPNFHSTRPYQASPCGDGPTAVMCGNTIQIIEDTPSRRAPAGTDHLDVNMEMEQKNYIVTLTDAEFPIVGNTELTKNSQNPVDQFDDADKVNEYLNWYLTGTTDKAEYGDVANEGDQIINYSGPIKKLMPSMLLDAQRIETIKLLNTSETYSEDPPLNPSDTHLNPPAQVTDEAVTHNQIVVCTKNSLPNLPVWIRELLGLPTIGVQTPAECYPQGNGSPASGDVYRLNSWNGESRLIDLVSKAGPLLNKIIPQSLVSQALNDATDHWTKNYPPLPWSDENGQPFESNLAYLKAYNEWRGNICIYNPTPLFSPLICANARPILSNPYADFYEYVPLSNTVDKKKKQMITGVGINGLRGTELDKPLVAYEIIHEPILYFAHTAEVSEASEFLNKTYIPLEGTSGDPIPGTTEQINDPKTGQCRILDVRTNPGDYLFPEIPPNFSEINVDVKPYTVTRIPCVDKTRTIHPDPLDPSYTQEEVYASCQGEVEIAIRTLTKVPYAREIYNSTTAGANSTFRRIFPRVMEGAPITCVSNLPSSTNVTYVPGENADNLKVIDPLRKNTTDDAKLYFPYFGSVYDLFLKGIQTALRPQGLGPPLIDGKACAPANGTGECKMWIFEDAPGGGKYYDKIIQAAGATSCNGRSLNPAWALGIAMNENGGLMSDMEDGSSNSHFGCNIPEVQSIEDKISCMVNTLRNDCAAGKSDAQTLQEYGYLPGYQLWPVTILSPGAYPPPLWGSSGDTSGLVARLLSTNWFDAYKSKASVFCPSSPELVPPTSSTSN